MNRLVTIIPVYKSVLLHVFGKIALNIIIIYAAVLLNYRGCHGNYIVYNFFYLYVTYTKIIIAI